MLRPTQPRSARRYCNSLRRSPTPPFGEHRGRDGETAARRDGVRVFRQFSGLKAGSVKAALSRPAWLSTGEAVSRHTSEYPAKSMRGLRKPLGADWMALASNLLFVMKFSVAYILEKGN